jgi:hypothetical protein
LDAPSLPWTEIESDPNKTARVIAPIPYSAIFLAAVDENKEMMSTNKIGLTNQIGAAPLPPGFARSIE